MTENCYCHSFENKSTPSDRIFKYFRIIATTKENNKESTTVLQCSKCNSYYLLNIYNPIKLDNKALFIRKYIPKIDDKGLVKILKGFSGIVLEKEINTYSELYNITGKALKKMNPRRWIENASQN